MDTYLGKAKPQFQQGEQMGRIGNQGIVDLPIVIVICIFLASLVAGVGIKGLKIGESMKEKQKLIHSFDKFVEDTTRVSYGVIGSESTVDLELPGGRIKVRGRLIELKKGEETLKCEYTVLPLQRSGKNNFVIKSGPYSVKITEPPNNEKDFRLEIEELES